MNDIYINIINNTDDLSSCSYEWNNLLRESNSNSFFLTWEWLSSWAQCHLTKNRELFVLLFYKNDELVGVAPLYIERSKIGPLSFRKICFLGWPETGSDYLDVFARRGAVKEVADAFYDFFTVGQGACVCDVTDLAEIPADSLFLVYLINRIYSEGKYAEFAPSSYCPVINLPKNEVDFYAQLSCSWRKKVKQESRIINREKEVIFEEYYGDNVASILPVFFRLYEEKAGWSSATVQPVIQKLLEKYIDISPVQVSLLSINKQPVGGLLHFRYGINQYLYLMAVDKKYNPKVSLGNYLVGESIKNAIDNGYVFFDFLKGMENYKFHWATGGKQTVRITFWLKTPVSFFVSLKRFCKNFLKIFLR